MIGAILTIAFLYAVVGSIGCLPLLDGDFEAVEIVAICAFWPVALLVAIVVGVVRLSGRALDALPRREPPRLPEARTGRRRLP